MELFADNVIAALDVPPSNQAVNKSVLVNGTHTNGHSNGTNGVDGCCNGA